LSIGASNQGLDTGSLNDPIAQHAYGVDWLIGQIASGNYDLLNLANDSLGNALPAANNPAPPSAPTGLIATSQDVDQVVPIDPNSIIGPKGSGTHQAVAATQTLPYQVVFQNQPTASAPAQQVVVTEQLDPPGLNWQAFRLGSFGFDGMTFQVPANSAFYQTAIDLTKTEGIYVDVTATIDELTGVATWTFTAIDPSTGEIPLNPTVGLLPPDNGSGSGDGFVSYTILANPSDPTGTVITAQATVIFTSQPPLATQEAFNTIDAGTGLTSSVSALPAYESSTQFNVAWSGSDDSTGSGLAGYTIFVSDNGGPYTPWLLGTTLTSAPYIGQNGHTYRFYSIAADNAGNVQAAPATPNAQTIVSFASQFAVSVSGPVTAGTPFTLTVTAEDPTGRAVPSYVGTINLSNSIALDGLPAQYTFAPGDNGSRSFTVTASQAGNELISVVDNADSSVTGSATFIIGSAASSVSFTGFPANATAGESFNITVSVFDQLDNLDTAYRGTISFSSSDPKAVLPTPYTFTSSDAGMHAFSVSLETAGTQSLEITDTLDASLSYTESGIAISPAATSGFMITGPGTSLTAGDRTTIVVAAVDAFGNPTPTYRGTVLPSTSDSKAVFARSYKFGSADHGVHTFPITFKSAGQQLFTIEDDVNAAIEGTDSSISVNAAAPAKIRTTGYPGGTIAGVAHTITVTIVDAYSNVVPGYTGTVFFTSSDGKAELPVPYTFTSVDEGSHTFASAFVLKTAGAQTMVAQDTVNSSLVATVHASVNSAKAQTLEVLSLPDTFSAGVAESFTVAAVDAYGNVASGFNGSIWFTHTGGNPILPATYTFTGADAGMHTFSPGVTYRQAGTWVFTIHASKDVAVFTQDLVITPITHHALVATVSSAHGDQYAKIQAVDQILAGTTAPENMDIRLLPAKHSTKWKNETLSAFRAPVADAAKVDWLFAGWRFENSGNELSHVSRL
jgi:hypothetical protein